MVGGNLFANYGPKIIELLVQAIAFPRGSQDEELFTHCRDNAISSLGKCLKHQL